LFRPIAHGALSEIWLAGEHRPELGPRAVVVKVARREDELTALFDYDARARSSIVHPSLPEVYDHAPGRLVLEYVHGESAASVIQRGAEQRSPLSRAFAARIIAECCRVVHHAHQMGMVHLDIAPQNVFVTYAGEIKVINFCPSPPSSERGLSRGRISYMSPEYALGRPLDARSDVFSLGVMLYEMCTQRRLFRRGWNLDVVQVIVARPIAPPSVCASDLSSRLESIIVRAIAKDPADRFQSADVFREELERYLEAECLVVDQAALAAHMGLAFGEERADKERLVSAIARGDEDHPWSPEDNAALDRVASRTLSAQAIEDPWHPSKVKPRSRPIDISLFEESRPPKKVGQPIPVGLGSGAIFAAVGMFVALLALTVLSLQRFPPQHSHRVLMAAPKMAIITEPPGATVYVDGKPLLDRRGHLASTPLYIEGVERHRLHLLAIEKEGYDPSVRIVGPLELRGNYWLHLPLERLNADPPESSDPSVPSDESTPFYLIPSPPPIVVR
jgi:serine/threonine-protein kinase